MHFAAFAYVGESVTHPDRYYVNNVGGSLSLLEAVRELDVGPMIFSSTCATYGIPKQCPIFEDATQAPVNPYGFGKLVVEKMLQDFGEAYGMRHVALRYFNAAGADPEGELGEAHDPETHLIPSALLTAAQVTPSLHVYGADYPTADGTCVRDYVHVSDLADAHVLALRYLLTGGESCSLNLGSGHGVSVRSVIEAARRVTGQPIPTVLDPRRAGDPPALYASGAAAQRVLGWRPRHTDLEEIVTHAWRWLQTALSLGYIR
jgi:UDP-glucose-4-epimerase GalE